MPKKVRSTKEVRKLCEEAMEVAIAHIQKGLGVGSGDFAGSYFTGEPGNRLRDAVELLDRYAWLETSCHQWNQQTSEPDTNGGDELRLVQTCGACPEQYDVFDGQELVGYLRLRHGYFYAAYPDVEGEIVYASHTLGDGIFEPEEREHHLDSALAAIRRARKADLAKREV